MVCQPRCALTVRIVEKHFLEPVSLLKPGRVLMALASLPRGTPALCRHVGLRPTPEDETQHLRAQQAACGPGRESPTASQSHTFPAWGNQAWSTSPLCTPVTLLSVPTAAITPCTLIIQFFLQIPCPHHWSSHQQPQGQPRTDQAVSLPSLPATQSVHYTCPFTPLLIPCEIFPINTPDLQEEVATSNRQCRFDI